MDVVTAIKTCFKKYFVFRGRAIRSEYWYFHLFWTVFWVLAHVSQEVPNIVYISLGICALSLIPYVAVSARRMHDLDRSGWSLLLVLIPFIGGIIILVMFMQPGTKGKNKFGKNPLKSIK